MCERDEKPHKIWYQNLKGRDHFEDAGICGGVILQWILKIQSWRVWTSFIWLRTGSAAGLLETW